MLRSHATGSCWIGTKPPVGTQPSLTANRKISISPSQKSGTERPSSASAITA